MHPNTAAALESVDAAVFSGDTLYVPEDMATLQQYLGRWNRAVAEHQEQEQQEAMPTLTPMPVRHFDSFGNHWQAHTDAGPAEAITLEGAKEEVRRHFAGADASALLGRVDAVPYGAQHHLLLAYGPDAADTPGLFIWGPAC